MRSKIYFFSFLFLVFFTPLSCTVSQEEKVDPAQVRSAIEEANFKFCEAVRQVDASGLAALYTDDALLLPPNSDTVKGKQAIEAFWNAILQIGVKDIALTIVDLFVRDDFAFEIGRYTLTIQPEGQEAFEDQGKYVVLWKLNPEGAWKLHVDIWNTSLPAQQ